MGRLAADAAASWSHHRLQLTTIQRANLASEFTPILLSDFSQSLYRACYRTYAKQKHSTSDSMASGKVAWMARYIGK